MLTSPHIPGSGPLAVGFSGGRDSTVLLHLLAGDDAARARGLRALHVDHGIHSDSAAWAEHCRSVSTALGVPFESRRVVVAASGDGPEAAARAARHAAFADLQRPGETIALAHHRDDQAETVLLRLLRGSGGDGLAGMRPMRPFGSGRLWRPLLAVPGADIAAYAARHGLHWIEDPSNTELRADRNFVRARVLPLLLARWPQAAAALARSAAVLATQAKLLADEDARRLALIAAGGHRTGGDVASAATSPECAAPDGRPPEPVSLDVAAFSAQPPAWRDRLLRAWVAALGLPPLPGDALATIAREVIGAGADAEPHFAWHGAQLRRWRGRLWAGRAQPALPDDWSAMWSGDDTLPLPTGDRLRVDPPARFDAPLQVRARRGGECLVLPGRRHHSALKQVLQDAGVPPWRRKRLPLLFAWDGELLAAGDAVVSARLAGWLDEHGSRLVFDEDGD